jgi:DNA-binding SARP family transcriptional activator
LSEAIWPGDEVDMSRSRLRNVLMRLRRASGDVVVRSGSGVKLAPGLTCDLLEFERLAADALASARVDPDLAGRLAANALAVGEGTVFVDFEYEEWAINARRQAEQRMIGLLDLLSVQAEDEGDLPAAQALAERALRLDRYTDSRYVRLAELLTMQQRVAAAIAVLDDAAEVAREMGGALPTTVLSQRNDLLRRAASS